MSDGKQRHGCLTAWLVLMLIGNAGLVGFLLAIAAIKQRIPTGWAFPVSAVIGVMNVVFVVAIFRWKKWGFVGLVLTSILAFVLNLMFGFGIGRSLLGLMGPAILYGVLQLGKERKGWTQLG
jgi:hypothetical protein